MGDLVKELSMRGLDTTGNRAALAGRLCKALKDGALPAPAPVPAPAPAVKEPVADPVVGQDEEPLPPLGPPPPEWAAYKGLRGTGRDPRYLSRQEDQLRVILAYDPRRRIINLSGPLLRSLSDFVKTGVEHGGMIDINIDGSVDRTIFGTGKKKSINISDMHDFEVTFHTHPIGRTDYMFEPPSDSDVVIAARQVALQRLLLHREEETRLSYLRRGLKYEAPPFHQVDLVFTHEGVYAIYITKPDELLKPRVFDEIRQAYNSSAHVVLEQNDNTLITRLLSVEKYGIYIFRYAKVTDLEKLFPEPLNNWPESIPLYIDPKEPSITLTKRGARRQTEEEKIIRLREQEIDTLREEETARLARLFRAGMRGQRI